MARRQTGDKPLPKPMIIQFNDIQWGAIITRSIFSQFLTMDTP